MPQATLLKKRLGHWCFPMNFGKYLRTLFYSTQVVVAFLICSNLDYLLLFLMFPFLALSTYLFARKGIE